MTREEKKVEKFTLYSQELKEMMYPEKASLYMDTLGKRRGSGNEGKGERF